MSLADAGRCRRGERLPQGGARVAEGRAAPASPPKWARSRIVAHPSVELTDADPVVLLPLKRGDTTVHEEMIIHGSGDNSSRDCWRRTYITAFRSRACVHHERLIGFTHSHNDTVNWQNALGALDLA